jgi:hypothetical protein
VKSRATQYFYILTIRLMNPDGGEGRIISDSETFIDIEDLTQEQKFGQALKCMSSRIDIWLLKGQSVQPDFTKFSVLFFQCAHDLGPAGEISVHTLKAELQRPSGHVGF